MILDPVPPERLMTGKPRASGDDPITSLDPSLHSL